MTPTAPTLQLALFDLNAHVGAHRCLFAAWLERQMKRKPARGYLPGLPAAQLRIEPCKAEMNIGMKLRQLVVDAAVVCGNERVEYVDLISAGYKQIRWYKGERIIGVGVVRTDDDPAKIKALLAPVLYARGWDAEACRVEEGAAWKRRATRRKLPRG